MKEHGQRMSKESPESWADAAAGGDEVKLRELIGQSEKLAEEEMRGCSRALVLAAGRGKTSCVKLLVEAGVDVDAVSLMGNTGTTAASLAARGGHLEMLKFLIDAGADIHAVDERGNDAVMWAANGGQVEALRLLLAAGASAKKKTEKGVTAAMVVAVAGQYECLVKLRAAGADLTTKDAATRWTAAHYAVRGWLGPLRPADESLGRCLALALEAGCDAEEVDINGMTLDEVASGSPACLAVLRAVREAKELNSSVRVPRSTGRPLSL